MEALEKLLSKVEAEEVRKWVVAISLLLGVAVALTWLCEYVETQRSARRFHAESLAAQSRHFEFHEDLRKKLVAMARLQAQPAIDLLVQLEKEGHAAQAH